MLANFVRLKGTGESQFRPAAADQRSILSVERGASAPSRIVCEKSVHRGRRFAFVQ
jgi:hypothetical protein